MSKVSLIHGNDRKVNTLKSLRLIEDEIQAGLKDKKSILLKPNIVNVGSPQGATRAEHLEAILEFLRFFYKEKIILGEGSGVGGSLEGFKKLGYFELKDKFDLEFRDLNKDKSREVQIFGRDLQRNFPQHVARTVFKVDYIVSCALFKTHDSTVVTLGIKNIIVGALQEKYQFGPNRTLHQGYPAMNQTLAYLATLYHPDLSVLDGFEAMEGPGPSHGDLVKMGLAIASTDFLAADILAMNLMGFKLEEVGYLKLLSEKKVGESDPDKMEIVGESDWKKFKRRLKPHPNYPEQTRWK